MQLSLSLAQRLISGSLAVFVAGAGLVLHPARSAADGRAAEPALVQRVDATPDEIAGDGTLDETAVGGGPGEVGFPDGAFGGAALRVMPLGDSLTWGKGSSDGSGYRVALSSWLALAGVDTDFVGSMSNGAGPDLDHEGHPGWRIAQIDAQVGTWVPRAAPDVILLDIGTNDLLHRDAVGAAPARLAALVDHLIELAPNARIVLAKLLVVRPEFRTFNAAMARIAAARPGHVWLADMSGISVQETVDRVHPTDLGYREMAAEWYRALTDVVPGARSWAASPVY